MKHTLIFFVILLPIAVPADARRSADGLVELTINLAKAGELAQKYQLMVKAEDQTDAGAVLQSVMPEGGKPKDMVNYVIMLKK